MHETEDKLKSQPPIEVLPPQPNEIQIMSEKLEKATKKVFEVLNQNTLMKNELKIAQKCLQQEISPQNDVMF